MDPLTLDPIDQLVTLLAELDPPVGCSMDPAEVTVPGCWVMLDEVRPLNVAGALELRCQLYLIGPDTGPMRGLGHAADLFRQVTAAGVRPDGPVVTQGVVLPTTPTALPALRMPLHLTTT